MNISIYIYGEFTSGYSQYPSDYTTDLFKKFHDHSKARTQLCIHRDGDIIYYAYIRNLHGQQYLGLCAVINGLMLSNIKMVFNLFEQIVAGMISRGDLVMFDTQGNITSNVTQLYLNREVIEDIQVALRSQFDKLPTKALPPLNFSVSKDSVKDFVIDADEKEILEASTKYGFTYIYKNKGYDTPQTKSYKGVITRLKNENAELLARCDNLTKKLSTEQKKQRNMKWVCVLGFIAVLFGIILWKKVLFPSEVTHYETGEFVYYGPLMNNKPNGVGVAIYPDGDQDGRRYYVGNFVDGKRQDKEALLLYKNGNYYYGEMNDDQRSNGIDFNKTDNSHYEGTFSNNKPYNGISYDHKKVYKFVDGKRKYAE